MTPEVSLALGGLPVAAIVFALVQLLKWGNFLQTGRQVRMAVIIIAVVAGAAWAAVQFKPEIGPVVTTLVTAVVGICGAVAAYQVLLGRKED